MGSKDIICTLHKKYDDDRRKLYELKNGNAKVDIVLNSLCMLIYGKKELRKLLLKIQRHVIILKIILLLLKINV